MSEFLSGGYLLAKTYSPPDDSFDYFYPPGTEPLPLLSASPCISDLLPEVSGGWRSDEEWRSFYESEWGISRQRVEAFHQWTARMTEEGRIRYGGVFADLEVARDCARDFAASRRGVHLIGLGLHCSLLAGFVEAMGPRDGWREGLHELVQEGRGCVPGSRFLGYEPLGVLPFEQRHSWLCHGLVREMHEAHDVRLASHGLVPSYDQACRVAAICDDPAIGCEPGVWRAWQIVEYDIKA